MKLFVALLLANSFSCGSRLYGRLTAVNAKSDVIPYMSDDTPEVMMAHEDDSPKILSKWQHGEKHLDSLNLFKKMEQYKRDSSICNLLDQAIRCIPKREREKKRKVCRVTGKCQYQLFIGPNGFSGRCEPVNS